jgi:hypothetical protein
MKKERVKNNDRKKMKPKKKIKVIALRASLQRAVDLYCTFLLQKIQGRDSSINEREKNK